MAERTQLVITEDTALDLMDRAADITDKTREGLELPPVPGSGDVQPVGYVVTADGPFEHVGGFLVVWCHSYGAAYRADFEAHYNERGVLEELSFHDRRYQHEDWTVLFTRTTPVASLRWL